MAESPLYPTDLLAHARRPRHSSPIPSPRALATARNPLCGDRLELALDLEDGRVSAVSVRTRGCAVAIGAGSMAAEICRGRRPAELALLSRTWRAALAQEALDSAHLPDALSPTLSVLALRARPGRLACARLAWDALDDALSQLHPHRSETP